MYYKLEVFKSRTEKQCYICWKKPTFWDFKSVVKNQVLWCSLWTSHKLTKIFIDLFFRGNSWPDSNGGCGRWLLETASPCLWEGLGRKQGQWQLLQISGELIWAFCHKRMWRTLPIWFPRFAKRNWGYEKEIWQRWLHV